MPANNIKNIYNILKKYGLDVNFIKQVLLPDWWDDEIANSKAGYLQAISIIAKNLSIDVSHLIEDFETITLKETLNVKFKTNKNISIDRNTFWVQSLAIKISEIINEIYTKDLNQIQINKNPTDIRLFLLDQYKVINLENVLSYLWDSGIPVIYISEFPKDLYKMDGMVINSKRGPIITLSKNRKHDAWLLFILLHEFGHFLKGHISNNETVIYDENLAFEEVDNEENEANEVALSILTGQTEPLFITHTIDNAFRLANVSRAKAIEYCIDSGIIVLNYAYHFKNFPLAEQSLKILNPNANAIDLIKKKMEDNLKIDNLTEENKQFFLNLTHLID